MNRRESKAHSDCYHDAIHTNIAEGVEKDTLPGQTDMKKISGDVLTSKETAYVSSCFFMSDSK
jgi:hypothetical protein